MHSPEHISHESSYPPGFKNHVDYGNVTKNLKEARKIEEESHESLDESYLDDLEALGVVTTNLEQKHIDTAKKADALIESKKLKISLENRLTELQQTDKPLSEVLAILKMEFAKTLDEESQAVLDKFSSLISPAIIPDKQEREAVEVLFATQSFTTFNDESFNGFIDTIYAEETVSEDTKVRIEKKFGIPRSPVKTGKELAQWTQMKDEEGKFIHSSPETALEFRDGMKSYVDKNGDAVVTIESGAKTMPMTVSPELMSNGEYLAQLANYGLIRDLVFEEFNGLTNLFGGGFEADLDNPSPKSIAKANKFAQSFIGKRSPEAILSKNDMLKFRQALIALHDPSGMGEEAVEADLSELGMLSNLDLQWHKIEEVGLILRNNQYFKTFEVAHLGDAHRLLKQELKAKSDYERQQTDYSERRLHATETSVHILYELTREIARNLNVRFQQ